MSAEKRLRERLSTIVQLLDTLDEMIETSYDVKFLDDWKLACIELGIDHTMEPHRAVRQWATRVVRLADLPDAEHIHFTRLPDGGWAAVAMEKVPRTAWENGGLVQSLTGELKHRPGQQCVWRDVPAAPEGAEA